MFELIQVILLRPILYSGLKFDVRMRTILIGAHVGLLLNDLCYDIMSMHGDYSVSGKYYHGKALLSPASEYLRQTPFVLGSIWTVYACIVHRGFFDFCAGGLMGLSSIGSFSAALYRAEFVTAKHFRARELLVKIGSVNCMLVVIVFMAAVSSLIAEHNIGSIKTKQPDPEELEKMSNRLARGENILKKHEDIADRNFQKNAIGEGSNGSNSARRRPNITKKKNGGHSCLSDPEQDDSDEGLEREHSL